jgi:hypothetical protein
MSGAGAIVALFVTFAIPARGRLAPAASSEAPAAEALS